MAFGGLAVSWPRWDCASHPRVYGRCCDVTASRRHGVGSSSRWSGSTRSDLSRVQTASMLAYNFFHVGCAAASALRAVLYRARHPEGPRDWHYGQSDGGVGHPTIPEPESCPHPARGPGQVPHPGPRLQVHRQPRPGVPNRVHPRRMRTHRRARPIALAQRFVGTVRWECFDGLFVFHRAQLERVLASSSPTTTDIDRTVLLVSRYRSRW